MADLPNDELPTTEPVPDCDTVKKKHSWSWEWDTKTWTNNRICNTCGKQEFNVTREVVDGYDQLGLPRK